ncbi:MAG: NAD(P)H-dependent oxidoreductase [Bacteriovoracaceae bacterium]|jgi:nitroreductase|nr:NAD(P)H-dependent oxidoreductase [Bacteriovoracaceae bacterium]
MSIIDDLKWRYAVKEFDPKKKVSKEDLNTILESLRLTASSYGMQPWEFVVVNNEELKEQLVAASYNQRQVKDASDLIVLCAKKNIDEDFVDLYIQDTANKRNQSIESLAGFKKMLGYVTSKEDSQKKAWAKNQIYIALGNLLTTCAVMKIDSCPMEGFSPSKYNEILGLDKIDLIPVLVCPIGYRLESDKYSSLPKVRFKAEQVIRFID